MRRHRRILLFLALLLAAAGFGVVLSKANAGTMDGIALAAHRAVYGFRLVSADASAGITGVSGDMYYEQDDACDAWTTDNRFSVAYQYPERRPVLNTNHYVSWEAKDQTRFSFSSERQENREMTEQLRGAVVRKEDGSAVAEYVRPDDLSFDLPPGYYLPAMHTTDIIRRARAGEKFFSVVMFDGTDAEGPVEANTFIGKKATAAEIDEIAGKSGKIDKSLLDKDAWNVRMAVFPLEDDEDMTPAYEMDLLLHANGVVSRAVIDYKNFTVMQGLQALEKLPARNCP